MAMTITLIVLFVLLVALGVVCLLLLSYTATLHNENKDATEKLNEANRTIANLRTELNKANGKLGGLQNKINRLKKKLDLLTT